MSDPTIAEMLASARVRMRAPSGPWWNRITEADVPRLHREALAAVGIKYPPPQLLAIVERTFTWEGYIEPHIRRADPMKNMVKNLRETFDDFGIPHA